MNATLLSKLPQDVFDYQTLLQALSEYASPRDRITRLLRDGDLVRIKKGLYVLGDPFRRRPVEPAMLANLIHGPSMVSLDYALAFHGLIPERVETLTSVTTTRPRKFQTPAGTFVYRPVKSLSPGMIRHERNGQTFLIAGPERALADKLCDDRNGGSLRTLADMKEYLFENLRIEPSDLVRLDLEQLNAIAEAMPSAKVRLCANVVRQMRRINE